MMHRGFYTDSCRFMPISTREALPSPIERNKAIQIEARFPFVGYKGDSHALKPLGLGLYR